MKPTPANSESERLLAFATLLGRHGREVECRIEGDSMGPTLPASAQARIRFAPEDAIEPGQIVAFVAGGHVIAHRVLRRGRNRRARGFLLTAGDGMLLSDAPVDVGSVLGPVTAVREGTDWTPPRGLPRLPLWRRALRFGFAAAVGAAMELSVPLARRLASLLIRARRGAGAVGGLRS